MRTKTLTPSLRNTITDIVIQHVIKEKPMYVLFLFYQSTFNFFFYLLDDCFLSVCYSLKNSDFEILDIKICEIFTCDSPEQVYYIPPVQGCKKANIKSQPSRGKLPQIP